MNKIVVPLKPQTNGHGVRDLPVTLQLLLDKGGLLADDEGVREDLSAALALERAEQTYGAATQKLVAIFQEERGLAVSGAVDEPTADALNRSLDELSDPRQEQTAHVVKGTVRFFDGVPIAGAPVTAFDRDLRSEQALGQSQTDKQGGYQIQYSERQFLKTEKGGADLVVKAFGPDGSVLAKSPVLFNAPQIAEVDLTVPAEVLEPPALFEKVGRTLGPLLEPLKVEELEEDEKHQDLTFLSAETGFDKPTLAHFAMAHRLARQGIQAEFWFVLLGGSFFQYTERLSLEEQSAAVLDALPSLDAAAVRKALTRGFNQKGIPESLRENVARWIEAFAQLVAQRLVSGTRMPSFAKLALEDAGIADPKKQETFARLLNEHKALTPELLGALEKDRSFKKKEIGDLRTSFQLSDLTDGEFSVVKMLKDEFGIRQPDTIRALAKKSESELVRLVQAKHAAGEIKLPVETSDVAGQPKLPEAEIYGKTLERRFREAFPTSAFAGALERALRNGGSRGLRHAKALGRFLERHENFELLNTPVDEFLANSTHRDFRALAKDENFRLEVKAVQRVFKLAPTFEATDALLADDVHSAQKIYRMGKTEFVKAYGDRPGFTSETARLAWDRAADTHAAVLTVVADLKALEAEGLPLALQSGNAALSSFPNWNNLFQTGDLCECEHCRSVLSPAAYFADLLMFLEDRKAANPARTVKDILFDRRPDLGFLELNCDNALTTLPYVDVVCEVLEHAVAVGENDVELAGFTTMPTDSAAAKAAVAAGLSAAGIHLGAEFTLSQVDPSDPDRWVAHGDDATYLLKKKTTANFFGEILRNTKASATELRAYPQYVNSAAYQKLREAKHPLAVPIDLFPDGDSRRSEQRGRSFALPFALFGEEVRAAFQKCNLQRWDLMRTLRGAATPGNPTDGEIAAEYFGIDADPGAAFDEKRLILVSDVTLAGQQEVWGETGNAAWLDALDAADQVIEDALPNVKTFLQKTGLQYDELCTLLDLEFINPAGELAIRHMDASCDTEKKILLGLEDSVSARAKLDRIHRFLRLWQKLKGWKMWELDLVIRHPRIGAATLNEVFLINLFHFSEVRKKLGGKTTVEQALALFGNLNTETRFTRLHEKREEGLYQNVFLNKKLIRPLDSAFEVASVDVPAPTTERISGHLPVVLAALGVREADIAAALKEGDDLTLANLSFLWRQVWLSKLLKFRAEEWKLVLQFFPQDVTGFASPRAAAEYLENISHLRASDFRPDELNWLLAADRSAKAAVKESDAARFLTDLRKDLQAIQSQYDAAQYAFLTSVPPAEAETTALLTSLLQQLHRDDAGTQFFIATLRDEVGQERSVVGLPASFADFPPAIKNTIAIRYDADKSTLRFTGLMTAAQRATLLQDPALAIVTGNAAYQEAINEFFDQPRLALKFFEPAFTAPLASLPVAVNFKTLPDAALASRISYDAEQRLLQFSGILSNDERTALDALSADPAYRNAVQNLATQPTAIGPLDERVWMVDTDLQSPQHNLVSAAKKALAYLSKTSSQRAVVQKASAQLGLAEALTRRLLTEYPVLPDTLLTHLTGAFAATTGVVDYATLQPTFDGWFWATRVAAIWKKWKITLEELEHLISLTAGGQLLDFLKVPLNATGAVPSIDQFLRTGRLLRLRDSLPEPGITLLEVLDNLNLGAYGAEADFAADVQRVNEAWPATDVETLITSLDLDYPADYLLAESWERLRRVFYFLENLNAGAKTVQSFAAAAMTEVHAKTLKELLRSKFGIATWGKLSTEIQDALRERKRDALAAYLLTQPMPADAPSGKWENTNDLYAYHLLYVEMASCQLTSRLVQGSGSVQLFVQRCFMGLERAVKVNADGATGDSAWRWWKWMRKYQPWQAQRKVFLWPENWIEPELKKDRSQFFKDLENELLQNEVNQFTVETAFTNYLEKLDGVAQLEIAGFYQEDDGDNAIVHLFGRTKGAEPHLHYYRRYDYRQWTPWEKVDLDIQGDYLIPAVVNKRLFLFWPVFTDVPDDRENSKPISIPLPNAGEADIKKPITRLRVQMAVSDHRQGKWTPKKVSKDFYESTWISEGETVRKFYQFIPIDRSDIDGRFVIRFHGYSLGSDGFERAELHGVFEIGGCKGVPELVALPVAYTLALQPEWASVGQFNNSNKSYTTFMKWVELGRPDEFGNLVPRHDPPDDDFTLENAFSGLPDGSRYTPILLQTPWFFQMSPPWHLSYFDRLLLSAPLGPGNQFDKLAPVRQVTPVGSWLPFFYCDKKRTFFVLPSIGGGREDRSRKVSGGARLYYPEIKKAVRRLEESFEEQVQTTLDGIDLSTLTPAQRQQIDQLLLQAFPEEAPPLLPGGTPPPYTPDEIKQVKASMKRYLMRFFRSNLGALSSRLFQSRRFHFKNFYHPFVCDFARLVDNPLKGIPALMSRETQLKNTGVRFKQTYQPTEWVVEPTTEKFYPEELVDFSPDGAYSSYNWELFFHAPLLIANSLSKNQRFEEARDWYHFIFNPIGLESLVPGGSVTSKYWITKPFFETGDPQYIRQRIENILRMLAGDPNVPGFSAQAINDLEDQVLDWRTNPFEPHRIANYRTVAYQKTVVMKYLDNLIAWGDSLFRQDSMESINEATQLYVLAAEILGPRPKRIPPQAKPPVESFNELEARFDEFSNALVEVENLVPAMPGNGPDGADAAPLPMLYFCVPQNDKMLGYWDTVADRLYKIRHCMNIEGVVRQLALFEPLIDPAALVKAIAGGVDISSALADLNAPLPLYRFNVLLQKANEVCNDVKALGGALLAALEKKDAEAMGLLRQGQEIRVLEAVTAVREKQIEEAKENLAGAKKSKELAEIKKKYYESREFMNAGEGLAFALNLASTAMDPGIAIGYSLAGVLKLIPDFVLGVSGLGSPHAVAKTGGDSAGSSTENVIKNLESTARALDKAAGLANTIASYKRRKDDWDFQIDLAAKEVTQIDRQIASAELRVAIAEKELENHLLQIENAKATDAFMRSKYTNQELYQWQVGQISGVYFQSYRLAYDLARRAERCFRFELGLQDSSYINFGYWDSLKKGLLSGEKLQYDLRRLEAAYLEQNRREYELTKHVSLALLDPLALVKLRETGRCFFSLPEEIFDLDYPGHYFRRIKSVSLTLPCVVGPFTTISCTLRLLKNSIRISTGGDYPRNADDQGMPVDDDRFAENIIPAHAIAVSSAQNDSGVFELSFRDERYLPFEGAGAVSEWSLELFTDLDSNNPDPANPDFGKPLRQFDYSSISDAVLHVKYTAREDAGAFKNGAVDHLREYLSEAGTAPSVRLFNLRQEFPTQWQRFLHPTNPAGGNVFELEMARNLFAFRDKDKTLKVNAITLLARCTNVGISTYDYELRITLPPPAQPSAQLDMTLAPAGHEYGGLYFHHVATLTPTIEIPPTVPPVKWQLRMTHADGEDLQDDPVRKVMEVEDVLLVLGYEWGDS